MIIRRPDRSSPIISTSERSEAEPATRSPSSPHRFDVARLTDNELVLFDREKRESWIVYPPRSAYEHLRRPTPETVLVEHHPWAPYSDVVLHHVRTSVGCEEHGLDCTANEAIQSGVDVGWNPFV
jgi:hypothetical protein